MLAFWTFKINTIPKLYRLFIIYGSKYIVILLPSIAYLAAFCECDNISAIDLSDYHAALAIIELVLAGRPGGNFFGGRTLNFGTPYYAIMISLNMIVTLLICLRLFQHKKTLGGALGKEQAKMYTSVASMLIESAAPCSLLGIMFLVPYARGDGVAIAFGQVWAKLTVNYPPIDEWFPTFFKSALHIVYFPTTDYPPRRDW